MIKIEINNGTKKVEMEGLEPLIYAEMGLVLREFYMALCKTSKKEVADKLILKLAKTAIMTDQEKEQEVDRIKRENPAIFLAASVLEGMHRKGMEEE